MSLRERKKSSREERIMKEAFRLFKEKGYASTSMQQIAIGADLAVGTLYNYFKSKDELFIAMLKTELEDMLEPQHVNFEQYKEDISEILVLSISNFLEITVHYDKAIWRDFYSAVMSQNYTFDSNVFSLDRMLIESLQFTVSHLQEHGLISKDLNCENIAFTLMGSVLFVFNLYMFIPEMGINELKDQIKTQFKIIEKGIIGKN